MGLLNGLKALTKKKKNVRKSSKAKKATKKAGKAKPKKKPKKKVAKKVKKKPKKQKKVTRKAVKNVKKTKRPVKKKAAKKKVKKKRAKKKATKKAKKVVLTPKRLSHAHAVKLMDREDAKEFIRNIAGEEGLIVFSYLIKFGREIDEFTLADRVNLQINFVRSLLYKLYEYKLVSFSRERDKKKGWFIYSWVAHPDRLKELLIRKKDEEIIKLRKKALDVQQVFYCKRCDKSYSYAKAMEYMFFCPSCGRELIALESSELRKKIDEKIEKIQKEKKEIESL